MQNNNANQIDLNRLTVEQLMLLQHALEKLYCSIYIEAIALETIDKHAAMNTEHRLMKASSLHNIITKKINEQ